MEHYVFHHLPMLFITDKLFKTLLKSKEWLLIVYGFILSCSTGLILDLPFILVSELVTIYYILTGLKTSLIQGTLTAMEIALIYKPLEKYYLKLRRCTNEKQKKLITLLAVVAVALGIVFN